MRNERILAFNTARKLTEDEVKSISAAGAGSGSGTVQVTFGVHAGNDVIVDGNVDG